MPVLGIRKISLSARDLRAEPPLLHGAGRARTDDQRRDKCFPVHAPTPNARLSCQPYSNVSWLASASASSM